MRVIISDVLHDESLTLTRMSTLNTSGQVDFNLLLCYYYYYYYYVRQMENGIRSQDQQYGRLAYD